MKVTYAFYNKQDNTKNKSIIYFFVFSPSMLPSIYLISPLKPTFGEDTIMLTENRGKNISNPIFAQLSPDGIW